MTGSGRGNAMAASDRHRGNVAERERSNDGGGGSESDGGGAAESDSRRGNAAERERSNDGGGGSESDGGGGSRGAHRRRKHDVKPDVNPEWCFSATIRFYEFPLEVLELVQLLRYRSLTLDGKLPPAAFRLSKLRFLDRHMSIRSSKKTLYLPMEIWDMKELQHLQVEGNDLVNPCGASLESLTTLLRVSPKSCTDEVFEAIPKLDKLGIQVELSPDDDGQPLSNIGHFSRRSELRSLKCVVVNAGTVPSSALLSTLPKWLRKLSLSGLGYAWEEMSKIDSLAFLRVLKLRNYAFRGADWEVREDGFRCLETLVIEDTDLVKWKIGKGGLNGLDSLTLKSCYKLKEIDGEFGRYIREIEMVDCKPLGAEQMKKITSAEVRVSCSWYDKKPKA